MDSKTTPLAGGALLALSLLLGAFVGLRYGQPSIGFLAGLGIGLALMGLVWLFERMRRPS